MKTRIRQNSDDQTRKLTFVIESSDDYTLATRRVTALSDCSRDHAAAQELNALLKAVRAWESKAARRRPVSV
jgi:hypothetical protein